MLSTEWLESSLFEVVPLLQWSVQVWAVHKHCHCWMWCCYPVWGMMVLILPGWTGTAASAGKPDTWGIRQRQDRQKWQLVTICESVLLAHVAQFAKFALTSRLLDWLRHREKCVMSQWSISFWFDLDQCTFTRQKNDSSDLTFGLNFAQPITHVRGYVSTKFEARMSLRFQVSRRHGTDRRTYRWTDGQIDGRGAALYVAS